MCSGEKTGIRTEKVGATMGTPRRKLFYLRGNEQDTRLDKVDVFIDEKNDQFINTLAALTGKEPSTIVNEAIAQLIGKYSPRTTFKISRWYPVKN